MQRIATYGFFVFEGCNGSGKTTVMNAVAERLRKQCGEDKIVTITNPTKGPVGVEARRFISEAKSRGEVPRFFSSNHETMGFATRLALLFMADRIAAQYANPSARSAFTQATAISPSCSTATRWTRRLAARRGDESQSSGRFSAAKCPLRATWTAFQSADTSGAA